MANFWPKTNTAVWLTSCTCRSQHPQTQLGALWTVIPSQGAPGTAPKPGPAKQRMKCQDSCKVVSAKVSGSPCLTTTNLNEVDVPFHLHVDDVRHDKLKDLTFVVAWIFQDNRRCQVLDPPRAWSPNHTIRVSIVFYQRASCRSSPLYQILVKPSTADMTEPHFLVLQNHGRARMV